jgi:hypothetical protein
MTSGMLLLMMLNTRWDALLQKRKVQHTVNDLTTMGSSEQHHLYLPDVAIHFFLIRGRKDTPAKSTDEYVALI